MNSLVQLRDKLLQYKQHRKDNMIDFMDWASYEKQNNMRNLILDRIRNGGEKKIFVAFGGNRSGKTELGAGVVAEVLDDMPNLKVMCSTVDYKLSVAVQQSKINKLIRKEAVEYGKFNPIRGYNNDILLMKNGARALFRSYQQGREAIQGLDEDLIWGDEEMPWDFFQESLARLTDRDGVFMLTFTSLSGFTRLVNFLWESDNPLVETAVLSILDNPFISDKAKDNYLLTVDPDEYESRVLGKPHLSQGLIYKEFKDINKVDRFDYRTMVKNNPRRYELHEGIDPHQRTPHHWMMFLYDIEKDVIYAVESIKAPMESMLVADYSRMIKTRRNGLKPRFCQIDTSSQTPDVINKHPDEYQENAQTIRTEFRRNGIDTILCTKDNAIGINAVKQRIKVVKTALGEVKRMPTLYVFNDLKDVLWEFSRYSWDSYATARMTDKKEMINRVLKKDDHFMDIIKYECIKMERKKIDPVEWQDDRKYGAMGY
jgi:phage terminase large subunit-like protein